MVDGAMWSFGTAVGSTAARIGRLAGEHVIGRDCRALRSMPSPVEALPCGSRSTISTCSPMAASAVPRLIAVVVLPTPPFWLAMAMTRGPAPSGLTGWGTGPRREDRVGVSVIGLVFAGWLTADSPHCKMTDNDNTALALVLLGTV